MTRYFLTLALLALAGCASQPVVSDKVWVSVVHVYASKDMQQSFNKPVMERFAQAGFTEQDVGAGRMLRVACALGTDYAWGSYAYLPAGMQARKDEILQLRVEEATTDDRMGLNPVIGAVDGFPFPGSLHAHRFIPDWKERNLFLNFERIPLKPEQQGRYEIVHSSYLIKCRQPD